MFKRALKFEGQREKGSFKTALKKQNEEEYMKIGLNREDVLCCPNWIVGANMIATRLK